MCEEKDIDLHESWGQGADGYPFGFEILWHYSESYVYFEVYERIGRKADGSFSYWKKGHTSSEDRVDTLIGAHPYMEGRITWDHDYQADFDHMHWGRRKDTLIHANLVLYIFDKSLILMGETIEES